MRIKLKQEQLINELFNKVKEKYPQIVFKSLDVSTNDNEQISKSMLNKFA